MQDQGNNNLILVSNKDNLVQSSAANKYTNIYTVLQLFVDLFQRFGYLALTSSYIGKNVQTNSSDSF